MTAAPSPTSWTTDDDITEAALDATEAAINFLRSPPRASLARSSNQTINNTTTTAVQWNAEDYDSHAGHDTVTNNSRYTAQYDGVYLFTYAVPWVTNTALMKMTAYLQRASDGEEFAPCEIMKTSSDITISLTGSHPIELATGDYVELMVWQNRGSSLQIDSTQHGGPRLSVLWVSAL